MAARTFAVVPAGGQSRRMGRPKLALPLGGRTVLEWVVEALRQGGIETVLVVIGPHVPELAPLAERAEASALLLERETPDMRATVEAGLRWLDLRFQPGPDDLWLLVPADHPTLDPVIVQQLVQYAGGASVVIPTYQERRGHPARIAWKHVQGLRELPAGNGLNVYFREHAAEVLELPVTSAEVLRDLDTPADYERLLAEWSKLAASAKR